jgi:hypothetical protein
MNAYKRRIGTRDGASKFFSLLLLSIHPKVDGYIICCIVSVWRSQELADLTSFVMTSLACLEKA